MSIDQHYIEFCRFVDNIVNINDFKGYPEFFNILEHVSFNQGNEYLSYIKSLTHIQEDNLKEYCILNDKYGKGNKYDYGFITTSPSNFRYILHSHLILSHISALGLNNINIVEVGGGYGGLCLAINYFSKIYNIKINTYSIVDLPSISRLQNMYLSEHTLDFYTQFYSSLNLGKDIDTSELFLISNYCFSELSHENQNGYITNLFPKVSHGFMAWNGIPLYDFGFTYKEEREYPLTGEFNKYIYF